MLTKIKEQIVKNGFVDEVRIKMVFNEIEYNNLVSALNELSILMKKEKTIDKELALYLYSIPQMIRYAYDSFDEISDKNDLAVKLEDAWIELDALVIEVLS
ncbi:hypothetical protein SM104_004119 [Cronobacter sakazakii]|uniref:hypothetical protein n=1 Tax=Cronobacter TaxID=413496 RepID=UPI0009767001|nr:MULTISPECIES: hypothetical protein [Cronobacter]ELQ6018902.1 hypothetical protein [Cronobacter sakazakii]ELY4546048.1 hypothetical protein [Cronobacter sakazakii]ELY4593243.1 hypothetical protein [Cronobacter sakazakii]ELY4798940.1 hypothetical protein [Cronobacter sakazakii]ELY6088550.1 hypothetical protein [Cronobacter sakazakii]